MSTTGKAPVQDEGSRSTILRLTGPMAVVHETTMTAEEKRAVLASWASDRRAVPDAPGLRQLDDGRWVKVADVLDALKHLDDTNCMSSRTTRRDRAFRSGNWPEIGRHRWRRRDDDDDPPTPTPAAMRPRPPVLEGGVAAVAEVA